MQSTISITHPAGLTTDPGPEYSVARVGLRPDMPLGPAQALGSGCSPESEVLPAGAWFGWIVDVGGDSMEFDLGCLWAGRLEPAASNDATRIRRMPVAATAVAHQGDERQTSYRDWASSWAPSTAENSPGLPRTMPFWIFVNDGVIIEVAGYTQPLSWTRSSSAWPVELRPGCCDQGAVAPASPSTPWPDQGWPADGFYSAAVTGESEAGYELAIRRWLGCSDHQGVCPDWWTGDEVIVDPDEAPYVQPFRFDATTMVVIVSMFSESSIAGYGDAFGLLVADINEVSADRFATEAGLTAGSTLEDLELAYPGVVFHEGCQEAGREFVVDPQAGWLSLPLFGLVDGDVADSGTRVVDIGAGWDRTPC